MTRALVEVQTEAKQLIQQNNFIKNKFILEDEIAETNKAMQELSGIAGSGDKDKIHAAIESWINTSRPYAERLMDYAIKGSDEGEEDMKPGLRKQLNAVPSAKENNKTGEGIMAQPCRFLLHTRNSLLSRLPVLLRINPARLLATNSAFDCLHKHAILDNNSEEG